MDDRDRQFLDAWRAEQKQHLEDVHEKKKRMLDRLHVEEKQVLDAMREDEQARLLPPQAAQMYYEEKPVLDALRACVTGEFRGWSVELLGGLYEWGRKYPAGFGRAAIQFLQEQVPDDVSRYLTERALEADYQATLRIGQAVRDGKPWDGTDSPLNGTEATTEAGLVERQKKPSSVSDAEFPY